MTIPRDRLLPALRVVSDELHKLIPQVGWVINEPTARLQLLDVIRAKAIYDALELLYRVQEGDYP